jgi:sugar lactone lactonase YvrE
MRTQRTFARVVITISVLIFGALLAQPAVAHTGFGMAVDRQGRVIFLDSSRGHVWRIEPDGKLTALASGIHADNLVQDFEGNLYAQNVNQTLWKIAPDGSVTQVNLPARAAEAGRVGSLDELLAIDRDGNFYVSDGNEFYRRSPQILKIAPQGEIVLFVGSEPGHADGRGNEARFSHIRSAAWGPDGALYVTDGPRVRRITLDGQVTTVAGTLQPRPADTPTALENGPWLRNENPTKFGRLLGIAVDDQGNIFVADSDNFRICRIARDGTLTTIHRTRLPLKPAGVIASRGNVYVMDLMFVPMPGSLATWFDTHRIRRISPDGSATTIATVGEGGGYVVGAVFAGIIFSVWWLRRRRRANRATRAADVLPSGNSLG